MSKTGLVSVTFRKLSPVAIVDLVAKAGLAGIEWGGDIHVPHGDTRTAKHVGQLTRDAGLEVLCYGSYYRVGHAEDGIGSQGPGFGEVLESAVALRAPTIRVWAGTEGSRDAGEEHWNRVIEDSHAIADRAAGADIRIAYEYHGHTLTDSIDGASRLLAAVRHPNVDTLWQPMIHEGTEANLAAIEVVRPRLRNVHVYAWRTENGELHRLSLKEGEETWRLYIAALTAGDATPAFLLEFVAGDSLDQFRADAATLRELVR